MSLSAPHRVVITGLGIVSPIGHNVPDFWRALLAGESGIAPIQNIPTAGLVVRNAAEVKNFDGMQHFDAKQLSFLDRFAQLALVAAKEAVLDSGAQLGGRESGCIIGTGVCGMETLEGQITKMAKGEGIRAHPFTVPKLMTNAAASQISMAHGLRGACFTIASACASATHAIGTAFHMVRSGMLRAAVSGGAEASVTYATLKGWEALRVMSPDVCRPFSAGRQGMVLGEGAGILVLERLDDAQARGAKIYAEIIGFGMSADAKDLTSPDVDGMVAAIEAALKDAALQPAQIGHVNAHGTGTRANDETESAALKAVFGDAASHIPVTANKSVLGHSLGAAGGLESVALALTLHHNTLPPTAHFQAADPQCPLDIVQTARALPANTPLYALKNSFAFGGLNAVLAMRSLN